MTSPIVIEGLTKTFGSGKGITDVNLRVADGEVCGFLGPNGAGKSTTIRCLLGMYRPTRGTARVLGYDVTGRGADYRRDVGYLPGELELPETLSGGDVLARFGRMRGLTDTDYRDELVEQLGAELKSPIHTLSKGNKQKLGIVLAFMHRPKLLVLDEPTSGLDPLLQDQFDTMVREVAESGRTVLLSSHDLAEVQRVAHRVAIIRSGRIIVDDTVDALRATAPGSIEVEFSRDVDITALDELAGVTIRSRTPRHVVLTHTGPVAPVLSAIAPLEPDTISARPANLDELFLQLYGDTEGTHNGR